MDKRVRDFLINMIATSFSDIGYALRILLGDENGNETNSVIRQAETADDKVQFLRALADKAAESSNTINTPQSEEKPKAKRTKSVKTEKTGEVAKEEAPVTEEKPETTPEVSAPAVEEKKAEGPAKVEEPKHKTTLIDVRKIMTDLTKRGKGDIIQKVLIEDFKVSKLSDVKEEDYDDFVARVQYYADELEVENA